MTSAILVLRFWRILSYDEIANVLRISLPAVKMRLLRARQEFRRRYEEEPQCSHRPLPDHALQAFRDGDLPEGRRAAVSEHLRSCTSCAAAFAGSKKATAS